MALCGVGSRAPDFELIDQSGATVRLSSLVQEGPVVIFFYPKDETSVCTREACGFRDAYEDFRGVEGAVLGISRDSTQSHAAFAQNHRLPFPLLTDPKGHVAASFGVKKTLGLFPGRATFVIDRNQTVRLAFSSALDAQAHVDEALASLKSL